MIDPNLTLKNKAQNRFFPLSLLQGVSRVSNFRGTKTLPTPQTLSGKVDFGNGGISRIECNGSWWNRQIGGSCLAKALESDRISVWVALFGVNFVDFDT